MEKRPDKCMCVCPLFLQKYLQGILQHSLKRWRLRHLSAGFDAFAQEVRHRAQSLRLRRHHFVLLPRFGRSSLHKHGEIDKRDKERNLYCRWLKPGSGMNPCTERSLIGATTPSMELLHIGKSLPRCLSQPYINQVMILATTSTSRHSMRISNPFSPNCAQLPEAFELTLMCACQSKTMP